MIDIQTYRAACRRILSGTGTRTDFALCDAFHAQEAAAA